MMDIACSNQDYVLFRRSVYREFVGVAGFPFRSIYGVALLGNLPYEFNIDTQCSDGSNEISVIEFTRDA